MVDSVKTYEVNQTFQNVNGGGERYILLYPLEIIYYNKSLVERIQ